jgi:protein-tyrosine phosphatase
MLSGIGVNRKAAIIGLTLVSLALPGFAHVTDERVVRTATDTVTVSWSDKTPVDVYLSDRPGASLSDARLVSEHNRAGHFETLVEGTAHPIFLLREVKDGSIVRVAERALPLAQGSNFRDLGGYPAADGRHIRWGVLYRSGATPVLTDADVAQIQALGLKDMIDLRSSEERSLAPTRIQGVRYAAFSYSVASLMGNQTSNDAGSIYTRFPTLLLPQLRMLFHTLLADEGPLVYNCSAGQDRTGFATAMLLSALGVPRDVIFSDYLLSTTYRRPEFEMPKLDPAQTNNPIAAYYARAQQDPNYRKPVRLADANDRPLLQSSFTEIETHWGSVEAYLAREIGLEAADLVKLRDEYLE